MSVAYCTTASPCPVCEDVTFMAAAGETPEGMAARTGKTLGALERFLRQHEHPAWLVVNAAARRRAS